LGPESTVPMHPQLRLFILQLFLDFRATFFPEWPLMFWVITIHQVIWPSPGTLRGNLCDSARDTLCRGLLYRHLGCLQRVGAGAFFFRLSQPSLHCLFLACVWVETKRPTQRVSRRDLYDSAHDTLYRGLSCQQLGCLQRVCTDAVSFRLGRPRSAVLFWCVSGWEKKTHPRGCHAETCATECVILSTKDCRVDS